VIVTNEADSAVVCACSQPVSVSAICPEGFVVTGGRRQCKYGERSYDPTITLKASYPLSYDDWYA